MQFFVDESGHTGPNLFDPTQPVLYYGVLSSRLNVDVLAESGIKTCRKKLGVSRLHAAELGNAGIAKISDDLAGIQKRLDLRFDLYQITKADHAVISFFDQVFDSGMNPAMSWIGYWSPLRYVHLIRLARLFDEGLARLAWSARIERNDSKAEAQVSEVCNRLLERVRYEPDARSRELIGDVLKWAAAHPNKLSYNSQSKMSQLSVMPNVIGFQSVMSGIALRLKNANSKASRIVVDQQSQFNKAQKNLHDYYVAASKITVPFKTGLGLPEPDYKNIPDLSIEFLSGTNSYGLELVDIFLWTIKRIVEEQEIAPELIKFARPLMRYGRTDQVSLKAIEARWEAWFAALPDVSTEELERGKELHNLNEQRRLDAMKRYGENTQTP